MPAGDPWSSQAVAAWEIELWRHQGWRDRLQANRWHFSPAGEASLRQAFEQGAYRLHCVGDGAALAYWLLPPAQAQALLVELEPYFASVRFYPQRTTVWTRPALGTVFLRDVDWLRSRLDSYTAPQELRRMTESLEDWLPLREEMLNLLHQTRLEGWPFQVFPEGWSQRAGQLIERLHLLLERDVACHFPQRTTSELRELAAQIEQAVVDPSRLSGRQVGFARRVLRDTEGRWGEIGSAARAHVVAERSSHRPVLETARAALLRRLEGVLGWSGLPNLPSIAAPLPDGQRLPQRLLDDVLCCRIARPRELRGSSLRTVHDLAQIARRWTASLGWGSGDPLERLVGDSHAVGTTTKTLSLPWLKPLQPRFCPHQIRLLAQEMLSLCWTEFPEQREPEAVREELSTLLEWLEVPPPDRLELCRATRQAARGTPYERYYQLEETDDVYDLEGLQRLCQRRAARRGQPSEMPQARLLEESRLLEGDGLWFLWSQLAPRFEPKAAAGKVLAEFLQVLGWSKVRKNQRWQRHRRLAHLWQRLLFFLSLLPPDSLPVVLAELSESLPTDSDLRPSLLQLGSSAAASPGDQWVGWSLDATS